MSPRKEKVGPGHPYYQTQLESNRRHYQRNRQAYLDRNRRDLYGLSPEDVAGMGSVCNACHEPLTKSHIDHDHDCCPGAKTCGRCVAGILCPGCNRAAGFLDHDYRKALKLAQYLVATRGSMDDEVAS